MTRRLAVAVLLVTAALMCGCAMSNDEIIRETKKCRDAGLEPRPFGFSQILSIQCVPKEPVR